MVRGQVLTLAQVDHLEDQEDHLVVVLAIPEEKGPLAVFRILSFSS